MELSRTDAELLAAFPPVLRALLDAELAAGNSIVEITGGFPAPPVGACVKLARPLGTRPRASGDGIAYYDRRSPDYSGEITDAKRFFFILEPPHPPEPEPDMHAIRAELEARQRAADAARQAEQAREFERERRAAGRRHVQEKDTVRAAAPAKSGSTRVEQFRASMEMTYERWHDGTSYELGLLAEATPEERAAIESILVTRGVRDWRDAEALAALDTPRARDVLRETVEHGGAEFAEAVARYAPHVLAKGERTRVLVAALETCDFYGGLTQALLEVQSHHPRPVIEALWRGVMKRSGQHAYHFAAMLLFLHGKATSPHDWEQRPFLLRFVTEDRAAREVVFRELCAQLGVKPGQYLGED